MSLKAVQTLDRIYHSESFLYRDIPAEEMERLETLRRIREYEILGSYETT